MSSHQNTRIDEVAQEGAALVFARLKSQFGLPNGERDMRQITERLSAGLVTLFVAGDDKAFVLYNRKSRYAPFERLHVPEIQDLNTHPDYRGQGLATALVRACEAKACAEGCEMIGLGVGLSAAYGPAQCLYCKLGYLPDGAGLVYDALPVGNGASCINDDDLCLMMVKSL